MPNNYENKSQQQKNAQQKQNQGTKQPQQNPKGRSGSDNNSN